MGTAAMLVYPPSRVLDANDRVRVGAASAKRAVGGHADGYTDRPEEAKKMASGIQIVDDHRRLVMCGLSASFLFAIVSRLVDREARVSDTPVTDAGDTTHETRIRRSTSRLSNANF